MAYQSKVSALCPGVSTLFPETASIPGKRVLAIFENKTNLPNQNRMLKTFEDTEVRHQQKINN